jgi:uncharacterized BrkB/YihY/UPF0761 family membrane protein
MPSGEKSGNEQPMKTVPLGRLVAVAVTVIIVATAVAVVTIQFHTTTLVGHMGVVSKTPAIVAGSRTPYQIAIGASLAGLFLLYFAYAAVMVRRTGRPAEAQAEIRQFAPRRDENEDKRRAA